MTTGNRLEWRTSSYTNGNNCVEVGVVDGWRTSTYTDGNNCVEVARGTTGSVYIRHSKRPAAGVIVFDASEWATFIDAARGNCLGALGDINVSKDGTDTLVTRLSDGLALRYDEGEWKAFVAGVLDGEFDIATLAA